MKARLSIILWLLLTSLVLMGCLNVEFKEYRFQLKPDGSGEGTITFVNIVSQDDEGRDVSMKDFAELVTDYLEGTSFDDANPGYRATAKRLFEKDGKLMGEVKFTFSSLDSVGFFRTADCSCAPVLFVTSGLNETFEETDGKYLGENERSPFIVWQPGTTEFYIKTRGTQVDQEGSSARNLLSNYNDWKAKK